MKIKGVDVKKVRELKNYTQSFVANPKKYLRKGLSSYAKFLKFRNWILKSLCGF